MASYLLLARLQLCIARLLRLTVALALSSSLALLPRSSFLPRLSSSFTPLPIFILANLLVVAIAISSRFTALHTSFHPLPITLQSIPKHDLPSDFLQRKTQPPLLKRLQHSPLLSEVLSDDLLLVSSEEQSAGVHQPSQQTIEKFAKRLSEKVGAKLLPAPQMRQLGVSQKQLAVKRELAQKEHIVVAVPTVRRLARSKSDPRICDSETAPTLKQCNDGTVTIDGAIDMSMAMAPFERLVDEDFCKRCAEFIANNHKKWRKESLERPT